MVRNFGIRFLPGSYQEHYVNDTWCQVYWYTRFPKRNATSQNLRFFWWRVYQIELQKFLVLVQNHCNWNVTWLNLLHSAWPCQYCTCHCHCLKLFCRRLMTLQHECLQVNKVRLMCRLFVLSVGGHQSVLIWILRSSSNMLRYIHITLSNWAHLCYCTVGSYASLSVFLSGFVEATLCTTALVQSQLHWLRIKTLAGGLTLMSSCFICIISL